MLAALALLAVPIRFFAPPQPWILGFAANPRMPLVGDVDHDGQADLIVVYPPGDSIIDVSLTVGGQKAGSGFQGLTHWGKNCQAAAVGDIDDVPGADVVGIFAGKTLRLAGSFANGKFKDTPDWAVLPKPLDHPALASLDGGRTILAFSTRSGVAFRIDSKSREVAEARVPRDLTWIGDAGTRLVGQDARGSIWWIDRNSLKKLDRLGEAPKDSRPAAAPGVVAFGEHVWTPSATFQLAPSRAPMAATIRGLDDIDGDGDPDIVEFRYGRELHTGDQVLVRRAVSAGESDDDHDGLTNEEEARLGTDPENPDTDGDGLLDGWEVHGFRGLDLKAQGCDPRHADLLCLISRFESVNEERTKAEMKRAERFYAELKFANPDGKTGIAFHPIYLDPIKGDGQRNPWQVNRDRLRPEKWRGVAHWMQVTPGGGGQADELGDGGTIGEGAMWAVFVHELGHQIGLNHEGFWPNGACPIYTSLMNYNYSYSLEDDREKIRYSDGALAGYVLRETDLDEEIPLPYQKVKFLEKGPYRFRLKPNGKTTLIDWNWNGVFGEKHVRADINYAYSTNAGRRDDVGKSKTSPWLFVHGNRAFVLYGTNDVPADPKADPTLSQEHPGKLLLRRLKKPFEWEAPSTLDADGLIGDPVAESLGGKIHVFYATSKGVVTRQVEIASQLRISEPQIVASDPLLVPTVGKFQGRLYLFLTNPANGEVTYRTVGPKGQLGKVLTLDATSTNPVGMCEDTLTGEMVIGLAQDQDKTRPYRWQIRRYRLEGERLTPRSMEWVEGDAGQARGAGRLTVLFERSRDVGPHGRIYLYGRGMTSKETPWACTYVAHQIADRSVRGGWLVKRYYDEWTQSRSAPAAAWFGRDVIWAYRWVDGGQGPTDNNLHVGYQGLGIQSEPFGDHDDVGFIHDFGLRNSLLVLGRE